MGHINTGHGEHDTTVSFFIIRTDGDEPRAVYHRHRRLGVLTMFGGHVEKFESPWSCALRELVEETGYRPSQLAVLQPDVRMVYATRIDLHPIPAVCHTGQYPGDVLHFHSDSMYAFITDQEPAGRPADGESTEVELFTAHQLAGGPIEGMPEKWREIGFHMLTRVHGTWKPFALASYTG